MFRRGNGRLLVALTTLALCAARCAGQTRVIELLADKDSRYKISGNSNPVITAKTGESLLFRITARKAKTWNRDGSIHGFTLLRAKDRSKVPGWNFLLRPGVQEVAVNAPDEPGEYDVICTVICSEDHEGMHMRLIVVPQT